MNDRSNTSHSIPPRGMKPRRLALMASAAGLSMAVSLRFFGYLPFNLPAFDFVRPCGGGRQNTVGFADLVAKVEPPCTPWA